MVRLRGSSNRDAADLGQRHLRSQSSSFPAGGDEGGRNDQRHCGTGGRRVARSPKLQMPSRSDYYRVTRQSVGEVADVISQRYWSAFSVDLSQPRTETQQRSKSATDRDAGLYLRALRQRWRVRRTATRASL